MLCLVYTRQLQKVRVLRLSMSILATRPHLSSLQRGIVTNDNVLSSNRSRCKWAEVSLQCGVVQKTKIKSTRTREPQYTYLSLCLLLFKEVNIWSHSFIQKRSPEYESISPKSHKY